MGYMLNTVDVNNQSVFYVINLNGSGLLADHGSPKVPKWTSEHGHMSSRYAVHVATASWQGCNSRFMLKRVAWRFSVTGWIQGTIPSSIARTGVPTCPKQPVDVPIVGFFSSPENARPPWSKKNTKVIRQDSPISQCAVLSTTRTLHPMGPICWIATKHLDSQSPRRRTSTDVRSGSVCRHVLAQQAQKGPFWTHFSHAYHAKSSVSPEISVKLIVKPSPGSEVTTDAWAKISKASKICLPSGFSLRTSEGTSLQRKTIEGTSGYRCSADIHGCTIHNIATIGVPWRQQWTYLVISGDVFPAILMENQWKSEVQTHPRIKQVTNQAS